MKASELRIGNFISYHEQSCEIDNICTFEDIPIISLKIDNNSVIKNIIDCEPIKVTEELLTKFGFKEDFHSKYKGWLSPEINSSRIRINIIDNVFVYNLNIHTSIIIKYIHKLQNLFFTLTEKELKM